MSVEREHDIAEYLTRDGKIFLAPQYNIAFDIPEKDGGTCPDFVALDFERRHVIVVEVTTAANLGNLLEKVRQRETQWYRPLRRFLTAISAINEGWSLRFLGFVRHDNAANAKSQFRDDNDVAFFAIEDATFGWKYWTPRIRDGLPQ